MDGCSWFCFIQTTSEFWLTECRSTLKVTGCKNRASFSKFLGEWDVRDATLGCFCRAGSSFNKDWRFEKWLLRCFPFRLKHYLDMERLDSILRSCRFKLRSNLHQLCILCNEFNFVLLQSIKFYDGHLRRERFTTRCQLSSQTSISRISINRNKEVYVTYQWEVWTGGGSKNSPRKLDN